MKPVRKEKMLEIMQILLTVTACLRNFTVKSVEATATFLCTLMK